MSQKAWMNAYTKGSKALQDRLAKVHKANPEFQEFLKHHGMGANLSVKQSGIQKKSVATVKPTTPPHPERSNLDRLAVIKAAAEKQRDRRHAASNRSSFGGELGGSFSMVGSGFRTYRESLDEASLADKIRAHPGVDYYGGKDDDHMVNLKKGWHMGDGQRSFGNRNARDTWHDLKKVVKFKEGEAKEYGLDEKWDESEYKWSEQSPEWKEKVRKDAAQRKPLPPKKSSFASGMKKAAAKLQADRVKKTDESVAANFRKVIPGLGKLQAKNRAIDLDNELTSGIQNKTLTRAARMAKAKHIERFARVASGGDAFHKEDIQYKDGVITMRRGSWIAMRNGKQVGTGMPSDKDAKAALDQSRKTIGQKTMDVLKRKKQEIARGFGRMSLATESRANRNRIRSWDSAVLPVEHDHALTTPHPKAKLDALRAAGKHEQARELERSWLRKSMAKAKTENSNE